MAQTLNKGTTEFMKVSICSHTNEQLLNLVRDNDRVIADIKSSMKSGETSKEDGQNQLEFYLARRDIAWNALWDRLGKAACDLPEYIPTLTYDLDYYRGEIARYYLMYRNSNREDLHWLEMAAANKQLAMSVRDSLKLWRDKTCTPNL